MSRCYTEINIESTDIKPCLFEGNILINYKKDNCINIPIEYVKLCHTLSIYYNSSADNVNKDSNVCILLLKSGVDFEGYDTFVELMFPFSDMNTAFEWYKIIHNACI